MSEVTGDLLRETNVGLGYPLSAPADPNGYEEAWDFFANALNQRLSTAKGPLEELRGLSEKATAGPWKYSHWKSNRETYTRHGIGNSVASGQVLMVRSQASGNKIDWQFIVACVNYVRGALERKP